MRLCERKPGKEVIAWLGSTTGKKACWPHVARKYHQIGSIANLQGAGRQSGRIRVEGRKGGKGEALRLARFLA